MSTYTQFLYQIIFSPKGRQPVLKKENRLELFNILALAISRMNCHLYQINGTENHIHILLSVHPTVAVSSLVKSIKAAGQNYIKLKSLYPDFPGWQDGYSAFSYSLDRKEILINYIKNQEIHHLKVSFQDELVGLFKEHKVKYDERFLIK